MAVDGWAVTFGTARRGLGACGRGRSPPINGQCTNHRTAVYRSAALRF